ncbi:MAG TPA: bifunctional phosphopantothenoylcysteine decarboxylase/phosphopantothenate--cysteine ligase CoaBC [Polyangiaceae bacterium]
MNAPRRKLDGRRITLCVTGSIAAYKSVLLVRRLLAEGAELEVVLSASAQEFVGAATFSGLTGRPVFTQMFDASRGGELHVDLAKRTDLLVVAPASADTLARLASGRAEDLVSALVLAATCPVLAAPAMHPSMWTHPATQRNVDLLRRDARVTLVGPVVGEVASGDTGLGRMAEPEALLAAIVAGVLPEPLRGRHVVVTAGPTAEDIDPVRAVTNRSSGKMGFAVAARARMLGATVTLIAGPVALPTPAGVRRVDVRSANSMRTALWQALRPDLSGADALVMAAAVADYRPAQVSAKKLASGSGAFTLELVPNPDLLREIGHARRGQKPVLVGFALETEPEPQAVQNARRKLADKRVDLVVANQASEALERDDIRALLVDARDCRVIDKTTKEDAAGRILDFVVETLGEKNA